MKVMTIVGTRPELIRLSRIIPLLDQYCDHTFVHTGQNYDPTLKDNIFKDLSLRNPDYLGSWWKGDKENWREVNQKISMDINNVLTTTEDAIREYSPDKLLILGDTNSGLSAIVAKRYGIKVYHMEAGNRCYDDRVPEEINRRIIDHCSDVLMPYSERSKQHLLKEGIPSERVLTVGNPIVEVLSHYSDKILESDILHKLNLSENKYFLVTMHRSENVDNPEIIDYLYKTLSNLKKQYPVLISVHPHTRLILNNKFYTNGLILSEPFNFTDFVNLEKNAYCVITDSGTVQEECAILGFPCVVIRNTNERLETVENGNSIISGYKPEDVERGVRIAVGLKSDDLMNFPRDYDTNPVSKTVMKIILGVYP
jgi:UDP-N-acetylglucosamine 2-epimerase (non-hydrolysing)